MTNQVEIAEAALRHYHQDLPSNGKPLWSDDRKEWTVYAAIVATTPSESWIVSSATGTKCTAVVSQTWQSSSILHDAHAEVLARRGFVRCLWNEIADYDKRECSRTKKLLEKYGEPASTFRLRSDVALHMYISDSPCGDASIYDIQANRGDGQEESMEATESSTQFTGAKVLTTNGTSVDMKKYDVTGIQESQVAREASAQLLGKLRTKSGRSNLDAEKRSTSMSCSDKLVRWSVLGLQGSSLSGKIPGPIRLSSCIVGSDPRNPSNENQREALDRSLCKRTVDATGCLKQSSNKDVVDFARAITVPSVYIVDQRFDKGKAAMEKAREEVMKESPPSRKRKRGDGFPKFPPTGFSINWSYVDDQVEITVGARGVRQGKKPKNEADYQALESRLCRNQIRQVASSTFSHHNNSPYSEWKEKVSLPVARAVRAELFQKGPLAGWLVGGRESTG
mmetsp:Transcript_13373/g.27709  ORF Transcript_13373/g.27709 Transcript_13373/m.27709 type:complete len:451 (-) Transcript_13373:913-2265(-)